MASATPGTLNSCGLTVHCELLYRSINERVCDVRPMVRTTLVVVVSGSNRGGWTPAGSVAASALTRSDTSWRTCNRFARLPNTTVIADKPCSDFERIDCRP